MDTVKYIFGPVPSRRLGRSLGVSPVPKKTCNYSCVFCQLGRTDKMTNTRREYFPLNDILDEFDSYHSDESLYDVITVVGEGEPTLYSRLGELIAELKKRTSKPVAVITNGALLYDADLRRELCGADIVLPSLDSVSEDMFRKVDRAVRSISFCRVWEGLKAFSHEYKGELYLEIMLMDGINDDEASIEQFKKMLDELSFSRVYINTPVRPPAESFIRASSPEAVNAAAEKLGGVSIDALEQGCFLSNISDDYEAVLSLIRRHPMNQFEIKSFLESRKNKNIDLFMKKLASDSRVAAAEYKGFCTYRLR